MPYIVPYGGKQTAWRGMLYTFLYEVIVLQHCLKFPVTEVCLLLPLHRCVELIICEQMNKYKVRLKDISTLEFAENKAKSKLTHIRRSMVSSISMTRPTVIREMTHYYCKST